MTKRGDSKAATTPLEDLVERAGIGRGPAPVHLWHPSRCGAIDIRIDREGRWFHEGEPISRPALVRLFSGILRREADGSYVLVTPAERLTIRVEDVPFVAVEMANDSGRLNFRTQVGDIVPLDSRHPLRVAADSTGGAMPYLLVRAGLEARLNRPVALELLGLAVERNGQWGVESAGHFFVIADSAVVAAS